MRFACAVAGIAAVLLAGMAQGADFELTVGKDLRVLHGGQVLIDSDALTYGAGWDGGTLDSRQQDGMTITNVSRKDGDAVQYRREVGVSKDRVELTCQFRMPPYNNTPDKPTFSYAFRVPYERLKNTTATAFDGRVYGPKRVTITLPAARKDGTLFNSARYVAFTGQDLHLVVDLNPKGLSTQRDYGGHGFLGAWTVAKKGDYVEFSCGYTAAYYGGTFQGKALIYEGDYAWDDVHVFSSWKLLWAAQAGRHVLLRHE